MRKIIQNRLVFIMLALVFAWVLSYMGLFQDYFLTKTFSFGSYVKFSPIVVLFIIVLFDLILIRLLRNKPSKLENEKGANKYVLSGLYYLVLMSGGLLAVYFIRVIYESVGMSFQVDTLFEIGLQDLFWFVVFLNIFISYFLFSLFLLIRIETFNLSLKDKLIIVPIPLILLTLFVYFLTDFSFILPVVLSFLIYIFVIDIYMDNKTLNSTWIFTFIILIAGFTSLIIFSEYSNKLNSKRIENINSSLFRRNILTETKINNEDIDYFKSSDNYYFDTDTLSADKFLNQINNGYYEVSKSLYFRPLTGDYVKLSYKFEDIDKYVIYNYYNKIYKPKKKIIVLSNDRVISNNTNFKSIPVPEEEFGEDSVRVYNIDGLSFLKYKYSDELTIFDIEPIPSILKPFSLFSMLFVILGLILFIISLINSKINFLPSIIGLSFSGLESMRNRIQFSIIGLIIISFLALGIITFYYLIDNSEQYQKDIEKQYSHVVSKLLAESNDDLIKNQLFNIERDEGKFIYFYNEKGEFIPDKRRKHNELRSIPLRNIDINKYDEQKVNSTNKDFLFYITNLPNNKGGFIVNYFKLNNSKKEVSNVLSDFLNVYVLLFLLSGAIAIALANSISKPIEILGDKLELLNLKEGNEVLKWDKNDEIGKLIAIYNSTVKKLEESAKIITKIERDSAWREMAKQVAHEIKNPLTPLKLNIQYLQGIVKNSPERVVGMVEQIAPSLIEQINNLDKIATEFADFAKMPSASNENVKLNEIVKAVHDFFRKREDLDIQLYVPINDLVVFADKNHLVSILNNIIKNAIQAIPTDRHGKIVINLYKEGENSIIKITDNGSGIPDQMKSKVFSPNFTTKTSGTGLGLAISVNMIQAFNGKIYFETEVDKGTSFFVEIPLMRLVSNFPNQKVVSLDD